MRQRRTGSGTGTTGLIYLFGDHLGSTSVASTPSGTLTSKQLYKPWGESRYSYGSLPTTYKFTGQRQEASLGLYYYGARWYDPALGRFIQADTIVPQPGYPLAWDKYAYSYDNPLNYLDPSGHRACEDDSDCDLMYPSSFTKGYYLNILENEFAWHVSSDFTYQETKFIFEVAWDLRNFYSNQTSGKGKDWLTKNLGEVNFVKGSNLQKKVSLLNKSPTSLVFPSNTVHLMDNFMAQSERHVAHELNHVIDNKMAGKLATFFGGGPADQLVKFVGGNPNGLRFWNGNIDVPQNYLYSSGPYGYANNSNADYFAESLAYLVYPSINPKSGMSESLPISQVEMWLVTVIDLTK